MTQEESVRVRLVRRVVALAIEAKPLMNDVSQARLGRVLHPVVQVAKRALEREGAFDRFEYIMSLGTFLDVLAILSEGLPREHAQSA